VQLTREEVIAHKDDFILITFDPANENETAPKGYPPPLKTDLWWIWPVGEVATLLGWLVARAARRHSQWAAEHPRSHLRPSSFAATATHGRPM
jgi:hypothetical protein